MRGLIPLLQRKGRAARVLGRGGIDIRVNLGGRFVVDERIGMPLIEPLKRIPQTGGRGGVSFCRKPGRAAHDLSCGHVESGAVPVAGQGPRRLSPSRPEAPR
jgi:hypothetical protein